MRKRDILGTRLLAAAVLVPAFIFLSLFVEGGGWPWLVATFCYPPAALILGMVLVGDGDGARDD